jgi:hypothetical protein
MTSRERRPGTLAILSQPQARKLCAAALTASLAAWTAQVALLVGVLQHHADNALAWALLAATVPALPAGLAACRLPTRSRCHRNTVSGGWSCCLDGHVLAGKHTF